MVNVDKNICNIHLLLPAKKKYESHYVISWDNGRSFVRLKSDICCPFLSALQYMVQYNIILHTAQYLCCVQYCVIQDHVIAQLNCHLSWITHFWYQCSETCNGTICCFQNKGRHIQLLQAFTEYIALQQVNYHYNMVKFWSQYPHYTPMIPCKAEIWDIFCGFRG